MPTSGYTTIKVSDPNRETLFSLKSTWHYKSVDQVVAELLKPFIQTEKEDSHGA